MKKESILYEVQLEVLSKAYLNSDDIVRIVPMSKREAQKMLRSIIVEMEENGEPTFNRKAMYVPTSKIIKALNLDVNYIRSMI